jgi:hypothetical protein
MATPQQKAFCILQFAKTNSVTTVQRLGSGYVKDVVYVPPLANDLQELRQRIIAAVATINGTCWKESGQKWTIGLACAV